MPKCDANDILQQVLRLSQDMIRLADDGDDLRRDAGCGVLFGRLRDAGYDLRNRARAELDAHATGPLDADLPETPRSRRLVLIVDDDEDIVTYLSAWFRDLGYRTLSAGNGFEAIEQALTQRPDLITLDMSMPEKSGLSTYRDLKGDRELCRIPVIIVTAIGRGQEEVLRTRTPLPRPEGFVTKPIDMGLLEQTVGRLLH